MKRAYGLRTKLLVLYLAATILPLSLTIWTSIELLDHSLNLAPLQQLDQTSRQLEALGRDYYQQARQLLARDAAEGRIAGEVFAGGSREAWPAAVREFWESGDAERFNLSGEGGRTLDYLRRADNSVRVYSRVLGTSLPSISQSFARSRATLEASQPADLRRGHFYTLAAVASVIWLAVLSFLIYWANRLTRPVRTLARGLAGVAAGDLASRLPVDREDEIGTAMKAFNHMADQLQQSREKLIQVTRLASWQALARKTAHEIKNSLTPIRLTMEEIIARGANGDDFLHQAAQIVVDEVISLERRVRAFSELASEPPVSPEALDINGMVEERIAFLRAAYPGVIYDARLDPARPGATADPDLLKGVLTNLIENAAEAVSQGGTVRVKTQTCDAKVSIEIHDSGPGLSPSALQTVFEPAISFKKNGMGLGLSIARKSALLCGGDVALIDGELGGAAFRIILPNVGRTPAARLTPGRTPPIA